MLFLLPGALVLSYFTPWLITPLLMIGGAYLAMEGYEKVVDLFPKEASHDDHLDDDVSDKTPLELENEKVASAIRTDFILSAEIMAITLSTVAAASLWVQGGVLAVVGLGMTAIVYGAVAIIVKADDVGAAMAQTQFGMVRAIGRGIVLGMPIFLKILTYIGMVAMLWVGGGIITHGLHELGIHAPEDMIKHAGAAIAALVPAGKGFVSWFVGASISAVVGLVIGAIVAPLAHKVLMPLIARLTGKPAH
jgi:uncharacterized protein